MIIVYVTLTIVTLAVVLLGSSVRVITQFERGVVFRFGRVRPGVRGPGLALIAPIADRLQKVQDYASAILQVAQASLRSIIGKSELDDLLSNRERLNQGLELMIDSPAVGWGVHIDRVEIKDVTLPESMSRQAEAERERRSRVITAQGEVQASRELAQAAEVMAEHPAALQLRLLQTVVEVAAEKNSTLVLPFPVELLRFLERATPPGGGTANDGDAPDLADTPSEPALSTSPSRINGADAAGPARPAVPNVTAVAYAGTQP